MAKFANSVLFTPTLGGTTDWTVSAAVQGFMTPAQAAAPDGVYKYRAESGDLSQWEVGEGTYTGAGPTLTRTTILQNSAGTTAKINFTTAPNVGIVALKQDLLSIEDANLWTYLQQAQARANLGVLKKNYIVNGGMQVSQENGSTAVTSALQFPADQWNTNQAQDGTMSCAQVASLTPGGSPNRIRWTVTAADTSIAAGQFAVIQQRIEGLRVCDLLFGTSSAKTIVIQFGVKAPAGTYCVALNNGVLNRSYIREFTISAPEANTDVVKSVTIPGDQTGTWATDNTVSFLVYFVLAAGTTFQTAAGAWTAGNFFATSNQFNLLGTNSNVFELFDVGLYEGNAAPAFQLPDYASELLVCQRYYQLITYGIEAYASAALQRYQTAIAFTQKRTASFSVQRKQAPATNTNIRAGDPATYVQLGAMNASLNGASISAESNAAGLMQAYTIIDAVNARL